MKTNSDGRRERGGVILLVGETRRPEFAPILRDFHKRAAIRSSVEMEEVRSLFEEFDVVDALKKRPNRPVVAILFFESRAGEFPCSVIDGVRAIHPLIPLIFIAGSACEGEGRTGTLPAGIIRYYWHEWDPVVCGEFFRYLSGESGRFSLPLTAACEDYYRDPVLTADFPDSGSGECPQDFLPFLHPDRTISAREAPECCVVSPDDSAMERFLLDLAAARGETACPFLTERLCGDLFENPGRTRRILFDSREADAEVLLPVLKKWSEGFPSAVIELLLFSPRIEEVRFLTDNIPRLRVISKPFDIRALFRPLS